MARVTGEVDIQKAFEKVMSRRCARIECHDGFLLYLMRAIVSRHLGNDVLRSKAGSGTTIESAPNIYQVAIPFFTVRDDECMNRDRA